MNIDKTIALEIIMLLNLVLNASYNTLYKITQNKFWSILSVFWGVLAIISCVLMIKGIYKDDE